MQISEQQAIREKTAAVMLDWANNRQPPFTGESAEGFMDAITAAHLIADEGNLCLHRWVDAARRTGLSWADIGNALGISKQAAQQRFKATDTSDDQQVNEGEQTVRFGVTAFNEMRILRDEGRKGNELVGTGAGKLIFVSTEHPWEYHRRIGTSSMSLEMQEAGWTYVSSWMPFHYYKRPAPVE